MEMGEDMMCLLVVVGVQTRGVFENCEPIY
jgi:hypothetical protein